MTPRNHQQPDQYRGVGMPLFSLIGLSLIVAAIAFVLGGIGSFFAHDATLWQRLGIAALPAGIAFVATLVLGWRDYRRINRNLRTIRRKLLARANVSDADFTAHFPQDDPRLLLWTRKAIARFFEVPKAKIHPTDRLAEDFHMRQLDPTFQFCVVQDILQRARVTPQPFYLDTTQLNDIGELSRQIQTVIDDARAAAASSNDAPHEDS